MNNLYACTQQGRTLLTTILMLVLTPLSILTFGQSPCTSPVIREATNAKSTNSNVYDDITIAMTNLLGVGTEAAWVMEPGGTFTENPDGTARFQGTVKQFGDNVPPRRMAMDIMLGGKSYSPDVSGPYNQTGVSTAGWYYYYTLSGSLTGLDALDGGKLSLAIHMHPFQVGIGANQMFNSEDQVANGAGGWFEWTVVTQPTDPTIQFTDYISGITISDFAFLLSGTPAAPCLNSSIGDQVYYDANNNGVFDAGELPATGLTVILCDANGVEVARQDVDANGKYLFTNLAAGTYIVKFPATTLDGKPQRDLGDITVDLTEGENFLDADKGYYKAPLLGSIGDQLYCDVNNNGIFDNGDLTVTGLTVILYDANGVEVARQDVDANGKYLFTELPAGNYTVNFPETTLDGKPQAVVGDITVDLTEGENYLDADKGYYKAPLLGSIGDQLYCDVNNNGIFDNGDLTVTGLTVILYDANGVEVARQDVDANGKYLFTELPAGNYTVNFPETTLDGKPQAVVGDITVTLTEGENYLDADKGYYKAPVDPCLNDTEAPVLVNCPTDMTLTADCRTNEATATWTVPTATDNCSTANVVGSQTSGTKFNVGTTVVTFTATDAAGNTAICKFNVVVKAAVDTQAPVLVNCPTDMTLTADCRTNEATATWTVLTATDNCSTANVVGSHTSGTKFNVGTTVVTFTATDAAGNTATCTFSVIVRAAVDTEAPVLANCPTSIQKDVVNSTSTCWAITWTAPTATDNCSTPTVTSNYNSGYCFPAGLTVVTYTATDAAGNTATCSFGVNIIKTTSCTVSGNTVTKSCVNNLPVLTGTALSSHEYMWVSSTTGCPTQTSSVIAGATGQNYNLPSRVTVTTYFARFARPVGCTTWALANGSNCITVNANECAPVVVDPCTDVISVRSVKNTLDNCGASTGQPYVALFDGRFYTAGSDLKFTEYTNGTALLKGTIYTQNVAYWINMTFSGKTTVSSESPKVDLCAVGQTSGSSWYYYTTTGGQINTPIGTYSLTRQGPAFQVGQFANLQQNTYGASGWFLGNGSIPGDVNFNLDPIEACGTVTPPSCSGIGATIYTDCTAAGVTRNLTVGNYTLAQLNAMGISDNMISSVQVYPGFKITLYQDDNFTTNPLSSVVDIPCLVDKNYNDITSSIKVECLSNTTPTCTVSGNTISKSCVNNLPVLTGTALSNYEYVWMKSTTGCPTQSSQAIAGATGQNYTLPSVVSTTTYFVRCARPIGCTTWGTVNESNCITVTANECGTVTPPTCSGIGATIYTDCVNTGITRNLAVGTYTLAQLKALGITYDNTISSVKVYSGFKVTLYQDDNFRTNPLVLTASVACLTEKNYNDITTSIKVECLSNTTPTCTVSGNTISKSCVNNLPVITGAALSNYEYVWMKSTTGCPTQSSQAIAGATGQNYSLPSRVTVTTYFVRCARPIGCTTWGTVNESNCITVYANECAPTATCSINFSSTKSYRIVSKKSGKALDVYGSGTYNDCKIVQWNYNGTANQQWRLFSLGSGYFKVMARNSGKYLACHYTSNGTPVYQYNYYSGGYKDWKIECVGNTGYYRLVHRASGKVLDVSGGSTANGAKMQIYTWTGTDNQLFKIEEVAPAAAAYSASSTVLAMNATAESDRVRLSWLSNTGYDNDFYTVEKMNASTGDFEKIALVNNEQFDDQVQTHVVNDAQPTEGDNFYRVKVTLNDGQEKITDVKKVTFKRMVGFGAFPNPASDELNVNLSEYTGNAVDIVIYNSFGKVMSREHVDNVSNATHQLDISELAAGQYHIRVSSEGRRDATQPVIIQK